MVSECTNMLLITTSTADDLLHNVNIDDLE